VKRELEWIWEELVIASLRVPSPLSRDTRENREVSSVVCLHADSFTCGTLILRRSADLYFVTSGQLIKLSIYIAFVE
jgi:hypothetical protein